MTRLGSFPADLNVAVIGATGGIGGALLRLLVDDDRVARIYAFARTPGTIDVPGVVAGHLDLEDEASIRAAASMTESGGPLDIVLVATGVLWHSSRPEKSLQEIDQGNLATVFALNSTGPVLVAKHFAPRLRKGSKTVFAALSARVGSIGDNRLGGWYAYRASKSALNMLLKTLSIEHARRFPDSVIAGLHPGTVDTGLSQPYTRNTPPDRLFAPDLAAAYLVDVLDALDPTDTGGVFAWDGSRIDY